MATTENGTGSAREELRFTQKMKELREARGWSQADLAEKMNEMGWDYVNQMTISRTEKNERPLRFGEARAISHILDRTIDAMVAPDADSKVIDGLWKEVNVATAAVHTLDATTEALLEAQVDLQATLFFIDQMDLSTWAGKDLVERVMGNVETAKHLISLDLVQFVSQTVDRWHQLQNTEVSEDSDAYGLAAFKGDDNVRFDDEPHET